MPNQAFELTIAESSVGQSSAGKPRSTPLGWSTRVAKSALLAALLGSVLVWLIPIRTPLWLDETISYWQISGGFWQIWNRKGLFFPAYDYILWAWKAIFGSSELALRIPSVLAMLAAVYLLYRIARQLFEPSTAMLACIVFCLHPLVVYAAIDARPYAFALLALNGATLLFLRWLRTRRSSDAILAGVASGFVLYFHYLFGVVLLAFGVVLLCSRCWQWKHFWKQVAQALAAFSFVMLPVVSNLVYVARTRHEHIVDAAPVFRDLIDTFAPGSILLVFALVALAAAVGRRLANPEREPESSRLICVTLAFVPALFLYEVSTLTSVHLFVMRYRIVAIPGIALCWALLLSRINSGLLRAAFCLSLLAAVAQRQVDVPIHGSDPTGIRANSWKTAVEVANANTHDDHAPVLVCSDVVESDYEPIPTDVPNSVFFAPLSYYKLSSPVVPLPRNLNDSARRQLDNFLATAIPAHRRFLLMSYQSLDSIPRWMDAATHDVYTVKRVGMYDGVSLKEYDPR